MNRKSIFPLIVVAAFLLALVALPGAPRLTQADESAADESAADESAPPRPEQPTAPEARSGYIPIQGRLTDADGSPLDGDYSLTFRLYDVSTGGTALCTDTRSVTVEDGLFSKYMYAGNCPISGQQLYLSIEVEGDGEMTPRQYLDNVPYAWSLRPGAVIKYNLSGDNAILHVENSGSGVGVYAASASGVALRAGGSGVVQSTAPSYLWISGSGARPYHQSDSTIIDMDTVGGAKIYRGATAGNKNVMLPITVPGTLYGQNVRLTGMEIHWAGQTEFDGLAAVLLRRQTGVCGTSSCYLTILFDTTDHVCDVGNNPTGCVQSYNLSNNNVLSPDSGVLYLTLELGFSGASTWVEIGGVRLTLAYDD